MSWIRKTFSGINVIVAVALAVFGSPFLGVGLFEAYKNLEERKQFVVVSGTVVGNSYSTTNDEGVVSGAYYPQVEFETLQGLKVRFTDGAGSLPADYDIGDRVKVLYNPRNAKEARISSWKRLWLVPTILTTVGLLPLVVFVLWVVWWQRIVAA
jgi:Protein of unknown function (DUF3592)